MTDRRIQPEVPELDGNRSYDPVSRKTLLVAGTIVGIALAAALAGLVILFLRQDAFHTEDINRNTKAIARLKKLEAPPTEKELQRAMARAIKICFSTPRCRRSLADTVQEGRRDARRRREDGRPPRGAGAGRREGASRPTRGPVQSESRDRAPSGDERPSPGTGVARNPGAPGPPEPAPAPSGAGGGSASPPEERPPARVETPGELPQPSICTSVLEVNC